MKKKMAALLNISRISEMNSYELHADFIDMYTIKKLPNKSLIAAEVAPNDNNEYF